jgi:hypothetical protein
LILDRANNKTSPTRQQSPDCLINSVITSERPEPKAEGRKKAEIRNPKPAAKAQIHGKIHEKGENEGY